MGSERHGTSEKKKREDAENVTGSSALPDNLDEFTHVDVIWHQELGFVQDGELFFSFIPLNDHLQETNSSLQLKNLFLFGSCW